MKKIINQKAFEEHFDALHEFFTDRKLCDGDAILLLATYLQYLSFNKAAAFTDAKIKKLYAPKLEAEE